jgi:DNA polymerase III subunit alpha
MSFVHLHVHSEFSLLDGMSRIPALVERAQQLDMPALALTDHGAMFGVIDFYHAARAAGVHPLIGMEAYLAPHGMQRRDPSKDAFAFHLLLLAENDAGYRNLLQIATASQLEGFYYRPRIDHDYLAAHSEGLICTSGCLSGEIPRALLQGQDTRARELIDWYVQVFGRERFFLELQHHDIPELPAVNRKLVELGKAYDLPFVATNDVHYVRPEDAELQDILLCIQTGTVRSDPDRMRMTDPSYYLRSPQEMQALFGEVPQALHNTLAIAERCHVDLDFKGYRLPNFTVPEGDTPTSYLKSLCLDGLCRRYGSRCEDAEVRQRLAYELDVISQMGFETYFLIVWDLCRFAREHGIWYNARGSAAGSIAAYCLEITLVDPLAHGLIFERFLNPGRVSMPDIDLDFQDDKRHLLLDYAADKYGRDKVAQIITFGTLGARAAVRDVGRVLDIPLPEVDRVAKLIPNIPGKPMTIPEALEAVPSFQEAADSAPYLREMVETAARLEGVARNAGTHAAGVIITDRPITEYVPLHRPTKGNSEDGPIRAVTQFEMQVLDQLGLLKVDFLGLSTLTVMERACRLIHQRHAVSLDIHSIPLDDPDTFDLLGRGDVLGVFQVEGAGMRRYLMEMKPQTLAHVTAMVALYRPGPMEFIPAYIRRMHGQEPVHFRHPELKPILDETYGITVYQEQIMYTAMNLAGYTASEADTLRKAVAKKKAEALHQERDRFLQGAVARGIPAPTAEAIFDDWEAFARYGFPKGHAADYAVICVETAYLKAHFPIEYMTALMSVFRDDTDKVSLYIADCRRMGFEVLPPDVNTSQLDFSIEDRPDAPSAIRYALAAIKNVGQVPVGVILEARERGGPFETVGAFARRVDLRHVGKRALESLVRVGALDSLGDRTALLQAVDQVMSVSSSHFRAAEIGQMSLFGAATGVQDRLTLAQPAGTIPQREQLAWEKELLGVYVSDHPLTPYMKDLQALVSHYSAELREVESGQTVCLAGEVSRHRAFQTRHGREMAFLTLEDLQGTVDVVVFSRTWQEISPWIEPGMVVVVRGRVDSERGEPKILADEVTREFRLVRSTETDRVIPDPPWTDEEVESPPLADPPSAEAEPLRRQPAPEVAVWAEGVPDPVEAPPAGLPFEEAERGDSAVGAAAASLPLAADAVRMLTLTLRSTGDKDRDARRLRRVHGLLLSYPGKDRFAFHVYEAARHYYLEFPNATTGYGPDLHAQIVTMLGEGHLRVEPLRFQ